MCIVNFQKRNMTLFYHYTQKYLGSSTYF